MEGSCNGFMDDDISLIMAEYSMPFVSGTMSPTHDALTQSQYGKVVFHDIADSYPTDSDVSCLYSLTCGVEVQEGDFVAVFRVGWDSIDEAILKHPALIPDQTPQEIGGNRSGQVLFRADALPKDEQEFYQLCYVTADGSVCGASVPFQFRRPHEEELCAVEGGEGEMVVVRSRTAVAEEKLHKVVQQQEEAKREKTRVMAELVATSQTLVKVKQGRDELKEEIEALRRENEELQKVVAKSKQYERQINILQTELKSLAEMRCKNDTRVRSVTQHSEMLTQTVEMLSADKARMAGLLRENVKRGDEVTKQLGEARRQVEQLQAELEDARSLLAIQAQEMKSQNRSRIQEAEKFLQMSKDNEQCLVQELAIAREAQQAAERQRQDLGLLREHRANLEQQLVVSEERHRDLRSQVTALSAKANDLANQVLHLSEQLAREKQKGTHTTVPTEPRATQLDCEQCETAGEQVSLLESQVRDLRLRLEMGAEEYKKIYLEKCRVEKKLAKLKNAKPSSKDSTPLSSPSTKLFANSTPHKVTGVGEGTSSNSSSTNDLSQNRMCPMCSITFPPGSSDLFTQHFENHLS